MDISEMRDVDSLDVDGRIYGFAFPKQDIEEVFGLLMEFAIDYHLETSDIDGCPKGFNIQTEPGKEVKQLLTDNEALLKINGKDNHIKLRSFLSEYQSKKAYSASTLG